MVKRPKIITLACIGGFIGAGILMLLPILGLIIIPDFKISLLFGLALLMLVVEIIVLIGLWNMRKWGGIGYIINFVLSQIISISSLLFTDEGSYSVWGSLLGIVVTIAIIKNYKRMK